MLSQNNKVCICCGIKFKYSYLLDKHLDSTECCTEYVKTHNNIINIEKILKTNQGYLSSYLLDFKKSIGDDENHLAYKYIPYNHDMLNNSKIDYNLCNYNHSNIIPFLSDVNYRDLMYIKEINKFILNMRSLLNQYIKKLENISRAIKYTYEIKYYPTTCINLSHVKPNSDTESNIVPTYQQLLQNENKSLQIRIKNLENKYVKKHRRVEYKDPNVIYIVTSHNNKQNRIYILGKATNLTNRLSTYNKSEEHEVIYYQSCPDENTMNVIENMVLMKLNKYKQQANRDRFVLPENQTIDLFVNVIKDCINFSMV